MRHRRKREEQPVSRAEFEALKQEVARHRARAVLNQTLEAVTPDDPSADDTYRIRIGGAVVPEADSAVTAEEAASASEAAHATTSDDGQQAIEDAAAAQTTADSKNVVFRQADPPVALAAGDLWIETDAGNRIWRWDGSSWVSNPFGASAIQNNSIGETKIQDDSISTPKIQANAIEAYHLAAEIVLASLFKTAESGKRVEFDSAGLRLYDTDGATLLVNIPTSLAYPTFVAVLRSRGLLIPASDGGTAGMENQITWEGDLSQTIAHLYAQVLDGGTFPDDYELVIETDPLGEGNGAITLGTTQEDGGFASLDLSQFGIGVSVSDGSGTSAKILDRAGNSDFVRSKTRGKWTLDVLEKTVNIPSTGAHSGGSLTVSDASLKVNDVVIFAGFVGTVVNSRQFHAAVGKVTTAGQFDLGYFNANNAVLDPDSGTAVFLVLHRS